jgi:hypothetical protein
MAEVFDAIVKVERKVKDPLTDNTLPPSGSLDWKKITDVSALAGTKGVDCKLETGDRWQEIKGALTENIKEVVKTTIG